MHPDGTNSAASNSVTVFNFLACRLARRGRKLWLRCSISETNVILGAMRGKRFACPVCFVRCEAQRRKEIATA